MSPPRRALAQKLVAAALALALVVAAVVFRRPLVASLTGAPEGRPVTVHAGPFTVTAALDPDPPRSEGGAIVLDVRDAQGAPIDDAHVGVVWFMPAMGAMAEMKGDAAVTNERDGRYRASWDLPMGGSWTLMTSIHAASGAAKADFAMTIGRAGLTAVGGSGAPSHEPVGHGPAVDETIIIDEARQRLIGIRKAKVVAADMVDTIRALGRVTYDEAALTDVTLKVRGWVEGLAAGETGRRVRAGERLFSLYSPELYAAQRELLLAGDAGAPLARAARKKLRLLGMTSAQIDALSSRGSASERVAVPSPVTGFVIEKSVVEGSAVEPGERLYRIASLDRVWIEADVYEADLPRVKVGQQATVTLDHLPGHTYEAKIAYVYPYLDAASRTGKVRLELANDALDLRPGMYATVKLAVDLGPRVQVPASAVVYTGPRRLVFVDLGSGRLRPQEVALGAEANGVYEVLEGLHAGDVVVTSGVFLVAADARIGPASHDWQGERGAADAGAVHDAGAR